MYLVDQTNFEMQFVPQAKKTRSGVMCLVDMQYCCVNFFFVFKRSGWAYLVSSVRIPHFPAEVTMRSSSRDAFPVRTQVQQQLRLLPARPPRIQRVDDWQEDSPRPFRYGTNAPMSSDRCKEWTILSSSLETRKTNYSNYFHFREIYWFVTGLSDVWNLASTVTLMWIMSFF